MNHKRQEIPGGMIQHATALAQATRITQASADDIWPEDETEHLQTCPVCESPNFKILYNNLVDTFMKCAPGIWELHLCAACGVAFVNPRPSPESIHRAYTTYYTHGPTSVNEGSRKNLRQFVRDIGKNSYLRSIYGRGESKFKSLPLIGSLLVICSSAQRKAAELWVRNLPKVNFEARFLDVGCGNGRFLRIATIAGYKAFGIDVDSKSVQIAQNEGLNAYVASAYEVPLENDYVDRVTMCHVIEHLHDPNRALMEINRVMKRGGVFWISTPNIESDEHSKEGARWFHLDPPRHLVLFSRHALVNTLAKAGFSKFHFHTESSDAQIVITCIKQQ